MSLDSIGTWAVVILGLWVVVKMIKLIFTEDPKDNGVKRNTTSLLLLVFAFLGTSLLYAYVYPSLESTDYSVLMHLFASLLFGAMIFFMNKLEKIHIQ
jgi:hypothetical protein